MITEYIYQKLNQAKYRQLEDKTYYADIPGLKGVWGAGKSLEICREDLREALEEWLVLKLKDGDKIPGFPTKAKNGTRAVPILKYA